MVQEPTKNILSEDDSDEIAALNAQLKHHKVIAKNNVENLKRIQRLEKLGGKQDYSYTIMEALETFGGEVNLSFLSQVLSDHVLLAEARKVLSDKKLIVEFQDKNRKILKLAASA